MPDPPVLLLLPKKNACMPPPIVPGPCPQNTSGRRPKEVPRVCGRDSPAPPSPPCAPPAPGYRPLIRTCTHTLHTRTMHTHTHTRARTHREIERETHALHARTHYTRTTQTHHARTAYIYNTRPRLPRLPARFRCQVTDHLSTRILHTHTHIYTTHAHTYLHTDH